jgi:hypothetical protein
MQLFDVFFASFFVIYHFEIDEAKMGRHKAHDPNSNHRVIKQGLPNIILPPYRNLIVAIITALSLQATKIANLASLLFLMHVSTTITFFQCFVLNKNSGNSFKFNFSHYSITFSPNFE